MEWLFEIISFDKTFAKVKAINPAGTATVNLWERNCLERMVKTKEYYTGKFLNNSKNTPIHLNEPF